MASFGADLDLIPIYLDAKTREDLIRLEFLNNRINQTKFNYMNPQQIKDGSYEVWFYANITEWQDPRELTEEELQFIEGFNK